MSRVLDKSHAHYRRALTKLPLGVASNFRFWGEERTIYVKYGRGARIVDIDDNEYIDYRMGYGPAILGHADPRVDEAAREGMKVGGVFALSTEREYHVAQRISKMVPAAELVRFSNSGTEAVMAALRLARAYTGKDDYVILEGSYHGLFDAAMWYTPDGQVDAGRRPGGLSLQRGHPAQHAQLRALRAGERCQPARGCAQAPRRQSCVPAHRAHHGQLPRHCGRSRLPARRAGACAAVMACSSSSMR